MTNNGLLIVTQKVDLDDEAMGFAHGWYAEFAKHFRRVTIICLYEGRHDLPDNVRVHSLGKEQGGSRLKYLFRLIRYSLSRRREYESIFVHMNPIYVVLMGLPWRLMGKLVTLWYAHGHTDLKLRLAVAFSNKVFTSTPEGMRIETGKRVVVGQGIDTERFRPSAPAPLPFTAITVGRLTRSKGLEILIRSFAVFAENNSDAIFLIVGTPATKKDKTYEAELLDLVGELNVKEQIEFIGSIPNADIPDVLHRAHLFLNAGTTGSLDKAVLEAMAAGIPVASSNEAVCELLRHQWERYCLRHESGQFTESLFSIAQMPDDERTRLGRGMSDFVRSRFGVEGLVRRIVAHLKYD